MKTYSPDEYIHHTWELLDNSLCIDVVDNAEALKTSKMDWR